MAAETLTAELAYSWVPFTFDRAHLTFAQHCGTRLESALCSHWGPAVYKWEGRISSGPNVGKGGILIGETKDLHQRIKQYISGTQERGNRFWREGFLTKGDVRLYILELHSFSVRAGGEVHRVSATVGSSWIVNARQ